MYNENKIKERIVIKTKNLLSVLLVVLVAIFLSLSLLATVQAIDTSSVKTIGNENSKIGVQKTTVADTQGVTEKKYKTVKKYTLIFNTNGGKVGMKTKKLAYKKNLGTLPKPTRSGYTFGGWYTKKAGGKKVSKTTKMPAKNMVVYAQWKKGNSVSTGSNRVLTASEKKLVGIWYLGAGTGKVYGGTGNLMHYTGIAIQRGFSKDGTYDLLVISNVGTSQLAMYAKGKWGESGGTIHMTLNTFRDSRDGGKTWSEWKTPVTPSSTMKYRLGTDENGQYLDVATEDRGFGTPYYRKIG